MTTLDKYRAKFQYTLEGRWITKEGTFAMMSDTVIFDADGKGTITAQSDSGKVTIIFEWKPVAYFTIAIKEIYAQYDDGEMEEDTESKWHTIEYEFKEGQTDTGAEVFLCAKGSDTFYSCTTRIGYAGKIE